MSLSKNSTCDDPGPWSPNGLIPSPFGVIVAPKNVRSLGRGKSGNDENPPVAFVSVNAFSPGEPGVPRVLTSNVTSPTATVSPFARGIMPNDRQRTTTTMTNGNLHLANRMRIRFKGLPPIKRDTTASVWFDSCTFLAISRRLITPAFTFAWFIPWPRFCTNTANFYTYGLPPFPLHPCQSRLPRLPTCFRFTVPSVHSRSKLRTFRENFPGFDEVAELGRSGAYLRRTGCAPTRATLSSR